MHNEKYEFLVQSLSILVYKEQNNLHGFLLREEEKELLGIIRRMVWNDAYKGCCTRCNKLTIVHCSDCWEKNE